MADMICGRSYNFKIAFIRLYLLIMALTNKAYKGRCCIMHEINIPNK